MRHDSPPALPTLPTIERFLDGFFGVAPHGGEPAGILHPRAGPVARIGLALDPPPALREWIAAERLDALFLHRPWRLAPEALPAEVGVIAYHAPFDRHLACGFNPRLADALGMADVHPFGERDGAPIGMRGEVQPQRFGDFSGTVAAVFDGLEVVAPPLRDAVRRVAVAGAMTDALVREAAAAGADVYLTGQLRVPARSAVSESGMGVVAVGHHRSEQWGLRALAGVLQERWPELDTVVRPLG